MRKYGKNTIKNACHTVEIRVAILVRLARFALGLPASQQQCIGYYADAAGSHGCAGEHRVEVAECG